jgi:hypothetical protein
MGLASRLLEGFPFHASVHYLRDTFEIRPGSSQAADLDALVREAESIASPKALFKEASIDSRDDESITVDGVKLTSRVLRVNVAGLEQVYPFVATCGLELEEWSAGIEGDERGQWVERIKFLALDAAQTALIDHLDRDLGLGLTSEMTPGSLEYWPIQQQQPLFTLLGEPRALLGVDLLEDGRMVPGMSCSGIRFASEEYFVKCALCPMEDCPLREAKYDEGLYDRKYGPVAA